jgi:hypothetical protein
MRPKEGAITESVHAAPRPLLVEMRQYGQHLRNCHIGDRRQWHRRRTVPPVDQFDLMACDLARDPLSRPATPACVLKCSVTTLRSRERRPTRGGRMFDPNGILNPGKVL